MFCTFQQGKRRQESHLCIEEAGSFPSFWLLSPSHLGHSLLVLGFILLLRDLPDELDRRPCGHGTDAHRQPHRHNGHARRVELVVKAVVELLPLHGLASAFRRQRRHTRVIPSCQCSKQPSISERSCPGRKSQSRSFNLLDKVTFTQNARG